MVHDVAADADQITIDVSSVGNTHIRVDGQWALWPAGRFPGRDRTGPIEGLATDDDVVLPDGVIAARPLSPLPVLPGTRRVVTTPLGVDLEEGAYVLDVYGDVAGVDIGRVFDVFVQAPIEGEPAVDEADATPPESPPADNLEDRPPDGG